MNEPNLLKKIENEKRQQIIDLNQQLHQEREAREADKEYLQELSQHLEQWKDDFHEEREARERAERARDELWEALESAAKSLEVIRNRAGEAPLLNDMDQVRFYAKSRAEVARRVLGGE